MTSAALAEQCPGVSSWLSSALFEHAPVSICVIDRDRRVVLENGSFSAVFGPSRGLLCHEVYKHRAAPCERCEARKTFRDGRFRVSDEHGTDMLGGAADFVVHHAPVVGEDGRVSHVINMSVDVTERNKLLREYNLLFEKVPCCLAVINRDHRIVRANEMSRSTFGEAVGRRCHEVYKHREGPCDACPARETFADGQTHSRREIRLSRGGEPVYHLVSTALLPHQEGDAEHVVEMTMDLTDVELLSARLSEKELENERLEVARRTAGQVAHGIKNILTGMQGGVYNMKRGLSLGAQDRVVRGIATFDRNFSRITRLVRAFLSFSKEHRPRPQRVDAAGLAADVVELYRPVAEQKGIELTLRRPDAPQVAWLDPDDLHTCLANLVTNALEACQASGRDAGHVEVAVEAGALGDGGDAVEGGGVTFVVSDDGCGMDQKVQGSLFRVPVSTKGTGGTGLGLLVTRKITRDHGGEVTCESTEGRGSVFRIHLPRGLPAGEGAAKREE